MINMQNLPAHRVENGVVIFNEPCSISLPEIKKALALCDSIVINENCAWEQMHLYAIASSKKYNKELLYMFAKLSRDKYSWLRHTGLTKNAILSI